MNRQKCCAERASSASCPKRRSISCRLARMTNTGIDATSWMSAARTRSVATRRPSLAPCACDTSVEVADEKPTNTDMPRTLIVVVARLADASASRESVP
eukprot:6801151-Prymnesium_polylepis.1